MSHRHGVIHHGLFILKILVKDVISIELKIENDLVPDHLDLQLSSHYAKNALTDIEAP